MREFKQIEEYDEAIDKIKFFWERIESVELRLAESKQKEDTEQARQEKALQMNVDANKIGKISLLVAVLMLIVAALAFIVGKSSSSGAIDHSDEDNPRNIPQVTTR